MRTSAPEDDITEDEIISIEDTYRETSALGSGRGANRELQNADLQFENIQGINEDESSMPIENKSMTIIQEEDGEYEESQFLMR